MMFHEAEPAFLKRVQAELEAQVAAAPHGDPRLVTIDAADLERLIKERVNLGPEAERIIHWASSGRA